MKEGGGTAGRGAGRRRKGAREGRKKRKRERGLAVPHCWMLLDAVTEAPPGKPELCQRAVSQCSLSRQGSGGQQAATRVP